MGDVDRSGWCYQSCFTVWQNNSAIFIIVANWTVSSQIHTKINNNSRSTTRRTTNVAEGNFWRVWWPHFTFFLLIFCTFAHTFLEKLSPLSVHLNTTPLIITEKSTTAGGAEPKIKLGESYNYPPYYQLRSTQSGNGHSGKHSIIMENLAQAGEGGGCTPIPFHYIYHQVQSCGVPVRSNWEGRYTLYSNCWSQRD